MYYITHLLLNDNFTDCKLLTHTGASGRKTKTNKQSLSKTHELSEDMLQFKDVLAHAVM